MIAEKVDYMAELDGGSVEIVATRLCYQEPLYTKEDCGFVKTMWQSGVKICERPRV